MKLGIKDMNGKDIEDGHIVCVRYAWNSYCGQATTRGLVASGVAPNFSFFSPHSFDDNATYQILGHVKSGHPDFRQDVMDWYSQKEGADIKCPIEITIYKNMPTL